MAFCTSAGSALPHFSSISVVDISIIACPITIINPIPHHHHPPSPSSSTTISCLGNISPPATTPPPPSYLNVFICTPSQSPASPPFCSCIAALHLLLLLLLRHAHIMPSCSTSILPRLFLVPHSSTTIANSCRLLSRQTPPPPPLPCHHYFSTIPCPPSLNILLHRLFPPNPMMLSSEQRPFSCRVIHRCLGSPGHQRGELFIYLQGLVLPSSITGCTVLGCRSSRSGVNILKQLISPVWKGYS